MICIANDANNNNNYIYNYIYNYINKHKNKYKNNINYMVGYGFAMPTRSGYKYIFLYFFFFISGTRSGYPTKFCHSEPAQQA